VKAFADQHDGYPAVEDSVFAGQSSAWSYTIHPHMTPKRLAYLRAVEADAPYEPRHGVVANHCLRLGWIETVVKRPDSTIMSWDEVPPGEHRFDEIVGQRLTAEGREVLRRAET
jgi:hypothetical protein